MEEREKVEETKIPVWKDRDNPTPLIDPDKPKTKPKPKDE